MASEYVMDAETITVRLGAEGFEVDRHLPGGAVGETLTFPGEELIVLPGPGVNSAGRRAREVLKPGREVRVHTDGTRFIGHLVPTGEQHAIASLRLPEPAIVFSKS